MLQVYTGNGKGKTTAAIGLAIRALGAGHKVYMLQFMKSLAYSEQKILQSFSPKLFLQTTGKPFFVAMEGQLSEEEREAWGEEVVVFAQGQPPADYVAAIKAALVAAGKMIAEGNYKMIVLDEVNVALFFGLLAREDLEDFFAAVGPATEIICTGRRAPEWLLDRADLVTDMQEVKHYYHRGIEARQGIEN